jgi:hypothetical protein
MKEHEVAGEIARHVGVSIAIDQATKPNLPHIPNTAAHESYLQGRYDWYKRTAAGWKTGEEHFRRAIREDPYYAAAYAGLAECRIPRSDALTAALKAISLDPNSGEAHTALELLQDEPRRRKIKSQLAAVVASLGRPGAARRAARAIVETLKVAGTQAIQPSLRD